jgi:hypothetical protein
MAMKYHGRRFITTFPASGQHPIPQFGILTATTRSRSQALVEHTDPSEHFTPECHGGAGTDAPHRNAKRARPSEELLAENEWHKTCRKSPEHEFEGDLSMCLELMRKDQASDAPDALLGQAGQQ